MRPIRRRVGWRPSGLTRRQRLLAVFVVGVAAVVLLFTLVYWWGMAELEGRPRSVFQAFNTVVETMTTTGYGADSPWRTPAMNLLVVTMQVTGVGIGFVTLRVLVIPLFERAPLDLTDRLTVKNDHVVVAEYRRDTELLLDELDALGVEYVLVDSDLEEAKRLSDEGYQAIHGDPEERAALDRATIDRAAMLITDAGDRTASVVLTALEANEDLRVISFTPTTRRKAALAEVGVDRSVAPGELIGRRLAAKATTPVSVDVGEEIVVTEVLVRHDSPLHGVRIGDSPLAAHPDLTLVAGWFDGDLRLSPSPDDRLTLNTVLVLAGPERAVAEVESEMSGVRSPQTARPQRVVVAGLGEGGRAAVDALPDGVAAVTVDEDPATDPDVHGDATEPETLRAVDLDAATALVVTVDDDATALLTVAMARSIAPEVEILVRLTEAEKTSAAVRAGADYVLSVQRVCARLVAAEVHGERVVSPVSQIRLVRADASRFAGERLGDVRRDPDRAWTVVGVSRGGTVHTDAETTVEPGDEMFVAGSDAGMAEFDPAE